MQPLPEDLQQTIRGFMESRVILTALELNVFTALGEGATAVEAAARMEAAPRATEMLLNALASMNLLVKQDGVFRNTPVSARFVDGAQDNDRLAALHTANLWNRWSTLTGAVRAGTSVWRREEGAQWVEPFIAAMHRNAAGRAAEVAQYSGAVEARRMLDVGGGSGAYAIAFAQASPALHAEILDRPEVLEIARRHIEEAGLSARVTLRPGDLRTDYFGTGFDLVLLSAICHMLSEAENQDLFRRCHAALAPGGRLVVQDFILNPDKTAPRHAALFSLNMLVGTAAGASYSEPEYSAWLAQAGFREIRHIPLAGPAGLIVGMRPRMPQ